MGGGDGKYGPDKACGFQSVCMNNLSFTLDDIDIPTAITKTEAFRLQEMAKDRTVIEVGSLLGYSTVVLGQVANIVYSIDPHEGYPEDNPRSTFIPFLRNLQKYKIKNVVTYEKYAQDVLPLLAATSHKFDFGFIDLNGKYDLTMIVLSWVDSMVSKQNGWLALHDVGRVNPDCSGATKAAQEYLKISSPRMAFQCETLQFFGPKI